MSAFGTVILGSPGEAKAGHAFLTTPSARQAFEPLLRGSFTAFSRSKVVERQAPDFESPRLLWARRGRSSRWLWKASSQSRMKVGRGLKQACGSFGIDPGALLEFDDTVGQPTPQGVDL